MKILSIQSHVSFGHVGNSCATFPLRLLGHEVIPINTVNFSNHTGYPSFRGHYTSRNQILDIFNGLLEIEDLKVDALLTGYAGDIETIEAICEIYKKLKMKNPNLLYFCDPVMGDHGKFYVKKGIPELMKERLIPIANYIFPNQFEFNFLTDQPHLSSSNIVETAKHFVKDNIKGIIISSFQENISNKMRTYFINSTESGYVETPTLELSKKMRMAGTGDLLSSLFTGNYLMANNNLKSLEKSVNSLFTILQNTLDKKRLELDLIGSQSSVLNGATHFKTINS